MCGVGICVWYVCLCVVCICVWCVSVWYGVCVWCVSVCGMGSFCGLCVCVVFVCFYCVVFGVVGLGVVGGPRTNPAVGTEGRL